MDSLIFFSKSHGTFLFCRVPLLRVILLLSFDNCLILIDTKIDACNKIVKKKGLLHSSPTMGFRGTCCKTKD